MARHRTSVGFKLVVCGDTGVGGSVATQPYTAYFGKLATDNHDSGYSGMTVQNCLQAHLGHYHILTHKGIQPKTDCTAKLLTMICTILKLVESTIQPSVNLF